jgi:acyl-CoA synthetase (AMP-forming)/AMP-acid ligase II
MACLTAGVVPVALPAASSADQLSTILEQAEVRYVFVDDPHQLRKLRGEQTLDRVEAIFYLERNDNDNDSNVTDDGSSKGGRKKQISDGDDDGYVDDQETKRARESKIISWRDFLRRGSRVTQAALDQQMQQLQSDQLASVVYASTSDHTTCVHTRTHAHTHTHTHGTHTHVSLLMRKGGRSSWSVQWRTAQGHDVLAQQPAVDGQEMRRGHAVG